ncbi:MAG: DUF2147 domain-containing protein [Burkholderiaceae bacterium]
MPSVSKLLLHTARSGLLACLVWVAAPAAQAAEPSPVGLWKTIDDETGKAKSLVRIKQTDGVLTGKVEKILTVGREDALCEACEGDLKNQPIVGLTIIDGLKKADDQYEGGTILDPNNGKSYKCIVWLDDRGQLNVRGYIGLPLLGRSQVWLRAE